MLETGADLLDPRLYAKVRRPLLEAETLPPWCYTSEAFFQRELETVFRKSWLVVGRAEQLPKPGDFFAAEPAGIPVIVARGDDGAIRAFSNSCRHRGARIVQGEGNCRAFLCPYHSWAYDLHGRLRGANGMEHTHGFNRDEYGLVPVLLEIWGGFLFVNFDPAAVGIEEWVGDLTDRVVSYHMEDLRCTRTQEIELACNWKVFVENGMEEFHLPTVHRVSISKLKMTHRIEEPRGEYCIIVEEHEGTRAVLPGEQGFPFIPSLTGAAAKGTQYCYIYPSINFAATKDCVFYLEVHPLAVNRTKLVLKSLFPQETIARSDFHEVVERYYRRLDVSAPEDFRISEVQQIGLSSPLARPGRLSSEEPLVHHIANWVLDRVLNGR
jgi:choline monooxygenase